jgi:chromosome partitioning protein
MGSATAVLDTDVILDKNDVVFQRLGIEKPTKVVRRILPKLIVTVAAWKGGVGKTELTKELGWIFNGVVVDLDWDNGGMSRNWGYRHQDRTTAPLLEALERGRVPRPLTGHGMKPDLVPSHPDFGAVQPGPEDMANALEAWSQAWKRPIVIDTHPGGVASTMGAVAVAKVIVVPVNLEVRALAALEGMAEELQGGYPLLFIPNRIAGQPAKLVNDLSRISATYDIPVGPMVSQHLFLPRRSRPSAVSAPGKSGSIPALHSGFVDEMKDVARAVLERAVELEERQFSA